MSHSHESDAAERLRARMHDVRGRLQGDAGAAKQSVSDMLDWRTYVKRSPLVSTAIAAGIGYFLVPRKKAEPSGSCAGHGRGGGSSANMQPHRRFAAKDEADSEGDSSTTTAILSGALSVAFAGLVRAGVTHLSSRLIDSFTSNGEQEQRNVNGVQEQRNVSRIRPFAARPR